MHCFYGMLRTAHEKAKYFFYCYVYLVLSVSSRKYSAVKIPCGFFGFLSRFIIISKLNTLSFCTSNSQEVQPLACFPCSSSDAGNEGEMGRAGAKTMETDKLHWLYFPV